METWLLPTAIIDGKEAMVNLSPAAGCLAWGRYCSADGFGHGLFCDSAFSV